MSAFSGDLFSRRLAFVALALAVVALAASPRTQAQTASAPSKAPSGKTSNSQASRQSSAASSGAATAPKQKTFSSPQAAAEALFKAAQSNDEQAMLLILGPQAHDVVMWTDNPADRKADIDNFVKRYEQMHRLVNEPDDEVTLYVGAENWPLPIPIVNVADRWRFDSELGRQEILYRRIGENELATVDTLRALADAEHEYYSGNGESGGAQEYARRLSSDDSKHDGLYWPGAKNPDDSPAGPFVAQASYRRPDHKPFQGYYFRILTRQGPAAMGGARSYIQDGKMTAGFALIAFPAEYRSSGVMTFIVNQTGVIYEKDLGPLTSKTAKEMTAYNPDPTWKKFH